MKCMERMTENIGDLSDALKTDNTNALETAVRTEVQRALAPTHDSIDEVKRMIAALAHRLN